MDKITWFAKLMVNELEANAYKGNWEDITNVPFIINELDHHVLKLKTSLLGNDKIKQVGYLADCANCLLMLGNAIGMFDGMSNG